MKKSKSSKSWDRLSELPDSLILHILSFLPMRDVVRTTLLSKRWKDLWTTIHCLNFCDDENKSDTFHGLVTFRNFVNRALLFWKGAKILKFDVDFIFDWFSCTNDLDMWLHVAMEKGVEELNIDLMGPHPVEFSTSCEYFAPLRLYSCTSIRKLSLSGCGLKDYGEIYWNQLKSLRIHGVCLSECLINQVLSSTPQLEVLILHLVESYKNLNIRSSSLKTLKIEKELDLVDVDVNAAMHTTLRIWAPNVEMLEISGVLYSKCLLMNISSVTSLTVCFYVPEYFRYDRLSGYKLFEEIFGQVFQSTRHVERVTLSDWCIKVLGEMKKKDKDMLAPLSNAKFLKLYARKVNEIVGLLEIFPMLTMLVLENSSLPRHEDTHCFEIFSNIKEPFVPKFEAQNSLESKTNKTKSYDLLHLRRVEITWTVRNNSVFSFIETLLKSASKLEKMVIRLITGNILHVPPESLFLAAQKLLSMPRSSPTAEVIVCKD